MTATPVPPLVRVLYTSLIAPELAAADIERLVASAQRRNRQLDLTGALLVCDGRFAQVLEGREEAVQAMIRKIAADHRHHGMVLVARATTVKRLFASWDMAFIDGTRCEDPLQDLLERREPPEQFLARMMAWIDERRSAPF